MASQQETLGRSKANRALNEPHYTEMTGNAPLGSMRCSVCCKCDSRNKDSRFSQVICMSGNWLDALNLARQSPKCLLGERECTLLRQSPEERIAPRIQQLYLARTVVAITRRSSRTKNTATVVVAITRRANRTKNTATVVVAITRRANRTKNTAIISRT